MGKQAQELRFAVRPRVVGKYLGQLCVVLALLSLAPLAVAGVAGDGAFALRLGVVTAGLGAGGWGLGRLRAPERIRTNEAVVVTAAVFLLAPLAMAWPLMTAGLNFVDALFEAISGVTTTGLTTTATVADKGTAFLFARAWMQWYGGLGIVVLTLALVVPPGLAAKGLAAAEEWEEDLVGGTRAHARRVLRVYLVLTGAGVLGLWLLRVGFSDAVTYTLAAVSTGGFAPHDGSLAAFGAWPARAAVTLLCVAGAVPLAAYDRAYRSGPSRLAADVQVRVLLAVGFGAILLLGATFRLVHGAPWGAVVRDAPLLALSAQTTAGFSTASPGQLDGASRIVLILAMMVGGGVGSTAGGFKALRLVVFLRLVQLAVVRAGLPRHAVLEPRLAGKRLGAAEIRDALVVITLFLVVIAASWLLFAAAGYDPLDSLFEVVSASATVGLSSGITGPSLPGWLKGVLAVDMLLGRLEMVAWLVVLSPGTWLGRRGG